MTRQFNCFCFLYICKNGVRPVGGKGGEAGEECRQCGISRGEGVGDCNRHNKIKQNTT